MTANPSTKNDPKNMRVLVVDDDEQIREMLKLTLETESFQVKTARDGRQILKTAIDFQPHLILSDVMMPGGGGYEVLRTLQSDERTRNIPIFVMTGFDFDASTKEMMMQEPNVAKFISKPIHGAALMNQVHDQLKTKSNAEKAIEEQNQNVRELDLDKFDDSI